MCFFPLIHEGISQLREKWNGYKQPKKPRRLTSLLISPRGEYVAVVAGNQITILKKEDDYSEPCGTFTSKIYLLSLLITFWNLELLS